MEFLIIFILSVIIGCFVGSQTASNSTDIMKWSLLGAIVAAVFTAFYNRHLARVNAVINLHSEFHSESFLKARITADATLKTLVTGDKTHLANLQDACCPGQWEAVSRLIHFFERLAVMREDWLVDRYTCDLLLGRYVKYFYVNYFELWKKTPSENPGQWKSLVTQLGALSNVGEPGYFQKIQRLPWKFFLFLGVSALVAYLRHRFG